MLAVDDTRVEIVTIGDELLLGFTIDTNAAHLARALAAIGMHIVQRTTVGDEAAEIARVVREALDRTGAVITTGGLGPTSDDLTKAVDRRDSSAARWSSTRSISPGWRSAGGSGSTGRCPPSNRSRR